MPTVISHANCTDGAMAAYAAWVKLGSSATYHFMYYHDKVAPNATNNTLYILDFSLKAEQLEQYAKAKTRIFLLDHHESALTQMVLEMDRFQDLFGRFTVPNPWQNLQSTIEKIQSTEDKLTFIEDILDQTGLRTTSFVFKNASFAFDMDFAGCTLAWDFFNSNKKCPDILRYAADRDLWKWELPQSERVSEALHHTWLKEWRANQLQGKIPGTQTEFEYLDKLAKDKDYVINMVEIEKRLGLVDRRNALVKKMIDRSQVDFVKIGNHKVPIAHAPNFHSWVAHQLCDRYKSPFALAWREVDDKILIDLRTSIGKGAFRVNRIAKKFGGGGHPKAAGFTFDGQFKLSKKFHA